MTASEPDHRPLTLQLDRFLPYQMVNLAKRISDCCSEVYIEACNISVAEWRILAHLAEQQRQNARNIGTLTFMDKSRVSRAVKQLHAKGYLHREKDSVDNRVTYLSLTEEGHSLYQHIAPRALEWEARLISALDITEYRDLLRIIGKLEQRLAEMEDLHSAARVEQD